MGAVLWLGSGVVLFGLARIVPSGRLRLWRGELLASLLAAAIFGAAATALDFGGWNEPDWRAGVFAALGAAIAIALVRIVRLRRRSA